MTDNIYCTLVEITATKTLLSRFENDSLVAAHTFNLGWRDITKELAAGMGVSFKEANDIRLGKKFTAVKVKKELFDDIFEHRCADLFGLIKKYLHKIDYECSAIVIFGVTTH